MKVKDWFELGVAFRGLVVDCREKEWAGCMFIYPCSSFKGQRDSFAKLGDVSVHA